ncbi:MAG TPA: DNA repair protein RecN [Pyrinomonadaceae bacterium]|nr:DNA repair protein RecN [Pyrinomonadaceae bacterium]
MLTLLKIKNIALIDSLEVEFGSGLNLLTGETGSGKSIIVDSLGALTGERVSNDLIKEGEQSATIEGLFSLPRSGGPREILEESGIELEGSEIIVRRELSLSGKNRVFINNQLVTQSLLKRVGVYLVDIHGQGEQATLFEPASHLEILDAFAGAANERAATANAFQTWTATKKELADLRKGESDKLQLLDILRFQVEEIGRADLKAGEDIELEEEKRRLNNVEKLTALGGDAYMLFYEQDESTIATLDRAARKIEELAGYDSRFADYREPLETARAVIEDAAATARDFTGSLEFSPSRLEEIEGRLAEISRLTRKYGGSIDTVLSHLAESEQRLENIETAEFREQELEKRLAAERAVYLEAAKKLHDKRLAAGPRFGKEVESGLKAVALEKAKFEVRLTTLAGPPEGGTLNDGDGFTSKGFDHVEFLFSANPGESPKPLAKVASGGEASRLMLVLKTSANSSDGDRSAVFDEIDAGIGGRVAEAVGTKLKQLSRAQQILCVTHQPQVAVQADRHFVVEKELGRSKTTVGIRELTDEQRVEEVARMLAGERITDSARTHAAEMIESARTTVETQRRRGAKG